MAVWLRLQDNFPIFLRQSEMGFIVDDSRYFLLLYNDDLILLHSIVLVRFQQLNCFLMSISGSHDQQWDLCALVAKLLLEC